MRSQTGAFEPAGRRHHRTGVAWSAPAGRARRHLRGGGERWQLVASVLALLVSLVIAIAPGARTGDAAGDIRFTTVSVAEGDTLWEMAARHPIPGRSTLQVIDVIRSANTLEDDTIHPGQILSVPEAGERSAAVAAR